MFCCDLCYNFTNGADFSSTLDFYRLVRISLAERHTAKPLTANAFKSVKNFVASIFTPQYSYAIA